MPKWVPAGLTQYVLNKFSKKSPAYHVTEDDVSTSHQRLKVEMITRHQSVRDRDGVTAVMYETRWTGLSRPSWERGYGPSAFPPRTFALLGGAGTPNQRRQTNRLYRRMRIGVAQRELSRSNGARFLAPGYICVSHANCLRRYCNTALPNGTHF